jgi:hypothetical protein
MATTPGAKYVRCNGMEALRSWAAGRLRWSPNRAGCDAAVKPLVRVEPLAAFVVVVRPLASPSVAHVASILESLRGDWREHRNRELSVSRRILSRSLKMCPRRVKKGLQKAQSMSGLTVIRSSNRCGITTALGLRGRPRERAKYVRYNGTSTTKLTGAIAAPRRSS